MPGAQQFVREVKVFLPPADMNSVARLAAGSQKKASGENGERPE